jgi:hypothetical protein
MNHPSDYARACQYVGEILSDRKWHSWAAVADLVAGKFPALQLKTIDGLIYELAAHGDVQRVNRRRDSRKIRLSTRYHR